VFAVPVGGVGTFVVWLLTGRPVDEALLFAIVVVLKNVSTLAGVVLLLSNMRVPLRRYAADDRIRGGRCTD